MAATKERHCDGWYTPSRGINRLENTQYGMVLQSQNFHGGTVLPCKKLGAEKLNKWDLV